jgi:hypothetical protein
VGVGGKEEEKLVGKASRQTPEMPLRRPLSLNLVGDSDRTPAGKYTYWRVWRLSPPLPSRLVEMLR